MSRLEFFHKASLNAVGYGVSGRVILKVTFQ
jgi:hypothetical protein